MNAETCFRWLFNKGFYLQLSALEPNKLLVCWFWMVMILGRLSNWISPGTSCGSAGWVSELPRKALLVPCWGGMGDLSKAIKGPAYGWFLFPLMLFTSDHIYPKLSKVKCISYDSWSALLISKCLAGCIPECNKNIAKSVEKTMIPEKRFRKVSWRNTFLQWFFGVHKYAGLRHVESSLSGSKCQKDGDPPMIDG